jgi:hypothetical protein
VEGSRSANGCPSTVMLKITLSSVVMRGAGHSESSVFFVRTYAAGAESALGRCRNRSQGPALRRAPAVQLTAASDRCGGRILARPEDAQLMNTFAFGRPSRETRNTSAQLAQGSSLRVAGGAEGDQRVDSVTVREHGKRRQS